ncbi:MAG: S8 family serine peptidase [Mariprofundaceae bacterium]|nr:S8 family serine peptidase [Mariprofundaceae bacterium]
MHKRHLCLCFFIIYLSLYSIAHAVVANNLGKQAYVVDEILIQFKTTTQRALRQKTMLGIRAQAKNRFNRLGVEHWKLQANSNVHAVVKQLQSNPAVLFAEPNYRRHLRVIPNDLSFNLQWGLKNTGLQVLPNTTPTSVVALNADIAMPNAWNLQTGSKNVIVAIVDDSLDIHHPDLAANIWVNTGEIANDGIDNDANGYIDDVNGWDFVNNDNDPSADLNKSEGHGSTVAGCVGAVGNNALGVAGVNWRVSLMPIKFTTDVASELLAFQYAIRNGAHIVNASWGGPQFSRAESTAVLQLKNAGILLVAAAGNYDTNNDLIPDYPSSLPYSNILAVAGSDQADQLMSFSHYGATSVDVAAPGLSILTTTSANAGVNAGGVLYDFVSGTSFSAPYVAGIAALLKAQYPNATYQELKGRILAGVDPVPSMQGFSTSAGRANANNALNVLAQPVLTIKSLSWIDGNNGLPDAGEMIDLNIELENSWQNATGISATLTALSANMTILNPTASYPNLTTDTYANPLTPFRLQINSTITGQQVYKLRLDIIAAGGYSISRYYQIEMGVLQNAVAHNGNLMRHDKDDIHFFHINIPAGMGSLTISTTANSDLDLLAHAGTPPQFDYQIMTTTPNDPFATGLNTFKSATAGSGNESITITNPVAGTWYVAVVNFDPVAINYPYTLNLNYVAATAAVAPPVAKKGCFLASTSASFSWLWLMVFLLVACMQQVRVFKRP